MEFLSIANMKINLENQILENIEYSKYFSSSILSFVVLSHFASDWNRRLNEKEQQG